MTKYAIVLGATGGIGQAICKELAEDGWSLYLHYYSNEQRALDLCEELTNAYRDLRFIRVQADFLAEDGAVRLAEQIQEVHAIVVANGQAMNKLLSDTSTADMAALWHVHMQNPATLIQLLAYKLRKHAQSYIVFIGSIWGNTGAAGEVMYSAVKGAQHAFVKAYAKEASYAGVRVNAVAPGWIETRMNEDIPEEEKVLVLEEIPLLRTGYPDEIAKMVRFLISGNADYMTGEIVKINGGWYI